MSLATLNQFEPSEDRVTFSRGFSFSFDQPVAENRLISVSFLNPQPPTVADTVQMAYDGVGRRVSITESHGTSVLTAKTFVWCQADLCQERDNTGHTVTKQYFGLGEQINGTNYFFTKDHLGSVREMTDSSGTIRANYDYDPFGRQIILSGDKNSDFGYTGFYMERTANLDLTWFREYDANKGRWLSRDPLGDKTGPNLYAMVRNDLTKLIDPLGLCSSGPYLLADLGGAIMWLLGESLPETALWGFAGLLTPVGIIILVGGTAAILVCEGPKIWNWFRQLWNESPNNPNNVPNEVSINPSGGCG